MSYRVYLKHDYKPVIRWVPDRPWYHRSSFWVVMLSVTAALWIGPRMIALAMNATQAPEAPLSVVAQQALSEPDATPAVLAQDVSVPVQDATEAIAEDASADADDESLPTPAAVADESAPPAQNWQAVKVQRGENLSVIFDRLGVSPAQLYAVMDAEGRSGKLRHLLPGQMLYFDIHDGQLNAMRFEPDIINTLEVTRDGDAFKGNWSTATLTKEVRRTGAVINSSLFLAGQSAHLSDNLIMRLVSIYGWDIDFAQDIREGDAFTVIYEEYYKGDVKVREGPILAAEFVNQGRAHRAVRFTTPDGHVDYYTDKGNSLRTAFLRSPLTYTRISSLFDLRRKHPILNRIRAHKGVDYAAPTGTPIKATGDGIVAFEGRKGGYGNTIVLKHGSTYSTLYAHMSAFARGLDRGDRVKQGQVIGYVGMTGLATGPHLHYEFQINGVHRNPLTVDLPKAEGVPAKYMADFRTRTAPLMTALAEPAAPAATVIAMQEGVPGSDLD